MEFPDETEAVKINGFPALRHKGTKRALCNKGPGTFIGYVKDTPSFLFIREENDDISEILTKWMEGSDPPLSLKGFTWLN